MKQQYYYDGPVMEFERYITNKWHSSTFANSESKARSNLAYQYKKNNNRTINAKISFPGEIIIKENL